MAPGRIFHRSQTRLLSFWLLRNHYRMSEDPYARLGANMWLLTPADVQVIADLSDELVALRIATIVALGKT